MPPLVMKLIFSVVPTQAPFFIRPLVKSIMSGLESGFLNGELTRLITFVQTELEKKAPDGKGWLAGGDSQGEPTMADYMMLFPLEAVVKGGRVPGGMQLGEALKNYVDAVHQRYVNRWRIGLRIASNRTLYHAIDRPAYQRALEKGGPYAYA